MTNKEIEQYVQSWMNGHEPDTFVKDANGKIMYTAKHSTLNLTLFFEDLLRDFIDSINEKDEVVLPQADVSRSVYAFDVNKECYCSLCERYYKNYKRFVIHMKKAKHYC